MPGARVFIFAPSDTESHDTLRKAGCEVSVGKASWESPQGNTQDELIAMAADVDALMGTSIKSSRITKEVMQASEQLRIVAKYTVGVDDVDVDAATELGILVTHAPTQSNWGAVAETTMMFMLTMLKKTRERDRHVKEGGWRDEELTGTYLGRRLDGYPGITVGIIGVGRIGGRVAELLRPWNLRIVGYDPYVKEERWIETGVEPVDMDTLLRESDVVTLHVVLNKETHHMMGEREFGLMKPTAIFINTSRGPAVDEAALVKALREDRIAGAALDVFEEEPLPQNAPIRTLGDKVILTPHMAASNFRSGLAPGIQWATRDVLLALRGKIPERVFNREVLPRWLERFEGRAAILGRTQS